MKFTSIEQFICLCLFYLTEFVLTLSCNHNDCAMKDSNKRSLRKERGLLFPPASTIGILAAIAVPLDDRKDVFVSYNFEANYNSPFLATDFFPGPLDRLQLLDKDRERSATNLNFESYKNETTVENEQRSGSGSVHVIETTNKTNSDTILETTTSSPSAESSGTSKTKRSLITRTNLYKSFERKMNAAGYNGHDCLLRAICEAAEIPLGLHNGVLGDIMHVIFTPSSSTNENILYDFYDAEMHGATNACRHYSKNCPKSIFDWISLFEER